MVDMDDLHTVDPMSLFDELMEDGDQQADLFDDEIFGNFNLSNMAWSDIMDAEELQQSNSNTDASSGAAGQNGVNTGDFSSMVIRTPAAPSPEKNQAQRAQVLQQGKDLNPGASIYYPLVVQGGSDPRRLEQMPNGPLPQSHAGIGTPSVVKDIGSSKRPTQGLRKNGNKQVPNNPPPQQPVGANANLRNGRTTSASTPTKGQATKKKIKPVTQAQKPAPKTPAGTTTPRVNNQISPINNPAQPQMQRINQHTPTPPAQWQSATTNTLMPVNNRQPDYKIQRVNTFPSHSGRQVSNPAPSYVSFPEPGQGHAPPGPSATKGNALPPGQVYPQTQNLGQSNDDTLDQLTRQDLLTQLRSAKMNLRALEAERVQDRTRMMNMQRDVDYYTQIIPRNLDQIQDALTRNMNELHRARNTIQKLRNLINGHRQDLESVKRQDR
ncbi:hypothetical protein BJX99DRAFT_254114 [Aspergillus californicus]